MHAPSCFLVEARRKEQYTKSPYRLPCAKVLGNPSVMAHACDESLSRVRAIARQSGSNAMKHCHVMFAKIYARHCLV